MLLTSALRGIDISVQGSLCREHDFASLPPCGGMRRGNAREREREKGERGSGEGWINEESERERASERERERERNSCDESGRYNFHKRENYSDQGR